MLFGNGTYKILIGYCLSLFAALLLISSCQDKRGELPLNLFPDGQMPLCLSVREIENSPTRTLVENTVALTDNCRRGTGIEECVGLFAEFTYTDPSSNQTTDYHLFNDNFDLSSHVYMEYYVKDSGRPAIDWNYYPDEDRYWTYHSLYAFRAYYPAKFLHASIDASSSSASLIIGGYNTSENQKDVLVAYKEVGSDTVNRSSAIGLDMFHALAAVKFRFRFAERDGWGGPFVISDSLTSCYLESGGVSGGADRFATAGRMQYGFVSDADSLSWTGNVFPDPAAKIYEWKHGAGLKFGNEPDANDEITATVATAYTDAAHSVAGGIFADNDGWVLIVPQQYSSDGNPLYLCFTTKKEGDKVTRVKIPAPQSDNYFKPNYKYTYTITITDKKIDVVVTLSIAPWNTITSDHSVEVEVPTG